MTEQSVSARGTDRLEPELDARDLLWEPPIASPADLIAAAHAIVATADLEQKSLLALWTGRQWQGRRLSLGAAGTAKPMPDRPGRPDKPELLRPGAMPKRSAFDLKGRVALLHSLAHIELNAIDMAWDLIGRFAATPMPRAYYDNWVRVGSEEAKHFRLICRRLGELGAAYGDLPAHDGLWQAAQATGDSLIARLAVVPLVLEARGLDVSPSIIAKLEAADDLASAAILNLIYRDEKSHVAFGFNWFRYLCEQQRLPLETTFHDLVRRHFRGPVKPPFNDRARAEAGLTPGFYKPLVRASYPS